MPRFIEINTGSGDVPPKSGSRRDRPVAGSPPAGSSFNVTWALVGLVVVVLVVGVGAWVGARMGGGGVGPGGVTPAGGPVSGDTLAAIDNQPLTSRDIDIEQAVQKVLQAQTGRVISDDPAAVQSFRRELLSQVVDQMVLFQSARKAGINPADAEVDAALPQMVGQYGLDGATLHAKVLEMGIADAEFRGWARRQVANGRFLQTAAATRLTGGAGASPEQAAGVLQQGMNIVLYIDGKAVQPVKQGAPAPDFALRTPEGEMVKLADLRGKPVMVNFWATWCAPCRIEMPVFLDAYNQNKDKLVIVWVNLQERPEQVRQFANSVGLTFPVVIDPTGETATIYQVRGLPTTIFVNKDGIVEASHRGAILSRPVLQPYIDRILGTTGG